MEILSDVKEILLATKLKTLQEVNLLTNDDLLFYPSVHNIAQLGKQWKKNLLNESELLRVSQSDSDESVGEQIFFDSEFESHFTPFGFIVIKN